jgi:hypothetical protein
MVSVGIKMLMVVVLCGMSVNADTQDLTGFKFSLSHPTFGQALFSEATGMQTGSDTILGKESNVFQVSLPDAVKSPQVVFSRGLILDAERFTKYITLPDIVPAPLTIQLLDETGKPRMSWLFNGAYIIGHEVHPEQVNNELVAQSLSFAYSTVQVTSLQSQ